MHRNIQLTGLATLSPRLNLIRAISLDSHQVLSRNIADALLTDSKYRKMGGYYEVVVSLAPALFMLLFAFDYPFLFEVMIALVALLIVFLFIFAIPKVFKLALSLGNIIFNRFRDNGLLKSLPINPNQLHFELSKMQLANITLPVAVSIALTVLVSVFLFEIDAVLAFVWINMLLILSYTFGQIGLLCAYRYMEINKSSNAMVLHVVLLFIQILIANILIGGNVPDSLIVPAVFGVGILLAAIYTVRAKLEIRRRILPHNK